MENTVIKQYHSPLEDTVEGMLHPDYKERFKAEYQQTKIRYEKLRNSTPRSKRLICQAKWRCPYMIARMSC